MKTLDIFIPAIMLIGMWLMGNKNKWCFPIMMSMNIIVIINSINVDLYGIAITNAIYIIFGIRNFIKWGRHES